MATLRYSKPIVDVRVYDRAAQQRQRRNIDAGHENSPSRKPAALQCGPPDSSISRNCLGSGIEELPTFSSTVPARSGARSCGEMMAQTSTALTRPLLESNHTQKLDVKVGRQHTAYFGCSRRAESYRDGGSAGRGGAASDLMERLTAQDGSKARRICCRHARKSYFCMGWYD